MQASRTAFRRLATARHISRPKQTTTPAHTAAFSSSTPKVSSTLHEWADPARREYKFWNREDSTEKGKFQYLLKISPESVQREARILSLAAPDDEANQALHDAMNPTSGNILPMGANLMGIGTTVEDFEELTKLPESQQPNTVFVSPSCPHSSVVLPLVLATFPSIEWVHVRSAGLDFLASEELNAFKERCQVTNAKGQFSSSLAEYVMMACSYFAKDLPLLMRNKKSKTWDNYDIEELRGKTLGIVGYGDIGRACAKLASVYGMRIVALRRHPYLSRDDCLCDVVYGRDKESLHKLVAESDYIVCTAPSTIETRGMVSAEAFDHVKDNAVFINLGRGPVVDEAALIKSLKSGKLKGAALDVFLQEPLPKDNDLWEMDNVLLSPHNMDKTATFMHEATEFFVNENLPRFICGEELLNPVDVELGY